MKQLSRYAALLVIALVIGIGVWSIAPADATAYTCGFGCSGRIGCNGQGNCPPGQYAYGIFNYSPPNICTNMCGFYQSGCVDEELCW